MDTVIVTKSRSKVNCHVLEYRRIFSRVGYTSTSFIYGVELSKCYQVNSNNYCFYTDGSVLSWDEAREFCARLNATLPIITNESVDNVFQQFIVSDSYSLIQNQSVWIAAHARPVNNSVRWHWIDGQPSGTDRNVKMLSFIYRRCLCLTEIGNILSCSLFH